MELPTNPKKIVRIMQWIRPFPNFLNFHGSCLDTAVCTDPNSGPVVEQCRMCLRV